jgi:transcriptional accessory protein Tex/SPT6
LAFGAIELKRRGPVTEQSTQVKVIQPKKIVKKLAIGMELEGTVRRLADFGAFVDIGVGRDGLVHISEMSQRRVAKPEDIVSVGDKVRVWIKDLDKANNRISLTMIPPGTKRIRDLQVDEVVKGKVTRVLPYAAFVDIGVGRDAMLHVREMSWGFVKRPEEVVKVGDEIEAKIIKLDKRRGRIDLSLKSLQPQPEESATEKFSVQAGGREERGFSSRPKRASKGKKREPVTYSSDDEDDAPSALALALQKALGDEIPASTPKRKKTRREKQRMKSQIDDIIERTLSYQED